MKKGPTFLDIILLLIQLILFVFYFWQPDAFKETVVVIFKVIGSIPMAVGGILLIWAVIMLRENLSVFASPQKRSKLVTAGIFAYIRHPIYTGIILLSIGYGIFMEDFLKLLVALLILLFFELKSSYEEKRLIESFPEYANYKLSTGKFLPAFMHFKITKVEKEDSSEVVEKETDNGNN